MSVNWVTSVQATSVTFLYYFDVCSFMLRIQEKLENKHLTPSKELYSLLQTYP